MLLYCNIWKLHFYNTRSFCSFSFYLNANKFMTLRFLFPFNSFFFHQNWTLFARTRAIFLKMVFCYKRQIWAPKSKWHSKACLTAETDSYRRTTLFFECILSTQIKKKMPNALKPHDNICKTMTSFRFLIKTKIVVSVTVIFFSYLNLKSYKWINIQFLAV